MTFLPEDYEQPASASNYLKIKDGETIKFRILSDSITGYVYFDKEKKPQRSKIMPTDWKDHAGINEKSGKQDYPKHFRSFVVWNYDSKKIQILDVPQKSIQDQIMTYYKDKDFGDPKDYDLKISRKGEGLDTVYTIMALGKTTVAPEIQTEYFDAQVKLDNLYKGSDPFTS